MEELRKVSETSLQNVLRQMSYPSFLDIIREHEKRVQELIKTLNLPAERGLLHRPLDN